MCCSVLQCVAVCCSAVLQCHECVAVCCSEKEEDRDRIRCSALQCHECVAVCGSVMNVLQCTGFARLV